MVNEMILALNEDLAREYAAAIQYIQHASVMDGLYSQFAGELRTHADDEIGHAKKLSDHINYLGGVPVTAVSAIFTASDNQRMLQQDLTGENDAINRYKKRIAEARAAGDFGTESILLDILADEESHANDIITFLGE